jgi:putative flippase GtrA
MYRRNRGLKERALVVERIDIGPSAAASRMWATVLDHRARLVRFVLVGISGVCVNTAVLYLLAGVWGMHHLIAAAIASEISIVGNFTLNDLWTFRGSRSGVCWAGRAARYNAVAFGGMVISLAVLAFLTLEIGMYYLIANFVAMAAATVSNYVLNTHFTWSAPKRRPGVAGHLEVVRVPVPVSIDR